MDENSNNLLCVLARSLNPSFATPQNSVHILLHSLFALICLFYRMSFAFFTFFSLEIRGYVVSRVVSHFMSLAKRIRFLLVIHFPE
jgi:hypothetical protein